MFIGPGRWIETSKNRRLVVQWHFPLQSKWAFICYKTNRSVSMTPIPFVGVEPRTLFFFIFVFSILLTVNKCSIQILLMTEFEPRTSGVRRNSSTFWATTTAHIWQKFSLKLCLRPPVWVQSPTNYPIWSRCRPLSYSIDHCSNRVLGDVRLQLIRLIYCKNYNLQTKMVLCLVMNGFKLEMFTEQTHKWSLSHSADLINFWTGMRSRIPIVSPNTISPKVSTGTLP